MEQQFVWPDRAKLHVSLIQAWHLFRTTWSIRSSAFCFVSVGLASPEVPDGLESQIDFCIGTGFKYQGQGTRICSQFVRASTSIKPSLGLLTANSSCQCLSNPAVMSNSA